MDAIKWICFILLATAGIVSCAGSDWWQAHEREQKAAVEQLEKPKIISRSDDCCAVYTFKAGGDWKYFTRCGGDQVTTQKDYSVPCGKSRCGRTETIETEAKP